MASESKEAQPEYLGTIARALGYLCLDAAELDEATYARSVPFLERLGFNRADCARILDTTTESIRVTLAAAKKNAGPGKTAQRKGKK